MNPEPITPTHFFQRETCGCVTINFHAPHTPASILFDMLAEKQARRSQRSGVAA